MEDAKTSADGLLELIAQKGWTEERAQRFEDEYGAAIRRAIVLHLWRLGLVSHRFSRDMLRVLPMRKLELFENALSDLWIALLDGLVRRYIREERAGRMNRPFLAYLSGTTKKIIITDAQRLGLLPRMSEGTMLSSLAVAKKVSTQHKYIALLKFHFEDLVRRRILDSCPQGAFQQVYGHLPRLTAYFFEEYLVHACRLERNMGSHKRISDLVEVFMRRDYKDGLSYVGHIAPYSDAVMTRCYPPPEVTTDEFLSFLALPSAGA